MDNDEQRDPQEEMDNAMTNFRENGTKVFEAGWNVDDLLEHMQIGYDCPSVEQDNDKQIVLYTGLHEAPDGSLWRFSE